MSVRSGQTITVLFTTRRFDTGAATDADSTPSGVLYVNGTANGASVTVTNLGTGLYKAAVTLPTLSLFDLVALVISATVNSVSDNAVVWSEMKDIAIDASGLVAVPNTQKVDVETIKTNPVANGGTVTFPTNATLASTTNITAGTITTATNVTTVNGLANNVITAASIAADALTAAKIADGAIDAATFAAGAINAAAIAADAITAAKVADGTIDAATFAAGAINATAIAADAITAAKIADGAIDAATFAAGAINAAAIAADAITDAKVASDVTIASVTGSVGSVAGAVGSVTGNVGGNVVGSVGSLATAPTNFALLSIDGSGRVRVQSGVTANASIDNFEFTMVLASDHVTPATGLSVTAERSIDGGAFSACANAVTAVGGGVYKISLEASDLNGTTVMLRFTAATADARHFEFITTP